MAQPSLSRSQLIALAAADARKYGVDPGIFQRQIGQESGFDPTVTSSAGAQGIAQFMPATAKSYGIDPLNPIQALDAAARYDSNELKAFGGDYRKALAAYNAGAGNADKYDDPNFAGGQTYRYVRDILGGSAPQPMAQAAQPVPVAPAAAPAVATPSAAGRQALLQAVMGRLSGQTPDFASLISQAAPAPAASTPAPIAPIPNARPNQQVPVEPLPASNRLALAAVPLTLETQKGIQVDQQILPAVEQVAKLFGVKVNSGYRSPGHNAAVGGAEHSDHLTGDAVDFTGSPQQMAALQAWALKQKFPYVEPTSQTHGSHVHISFKR